MSAQTNPLDEAWDMQMDAAKVGFDWPTVDGVIDKVLEEVGEVKEACESNAKDEEIRSELGDLLFAVINVCRVMNFHPNDALNAANRKFTRRFDCMCEGLVKSGKGISDASLEEMERMWEWAKTLE